MLKKEVEDDKVIQKQQKEMIDDLKKKERIRDENAKFQAIVKNIENKLEEKNKYTKNLEKDCDSLREELKKDRLLRMVRLRRNFPRMFNLDYGDKVKKYGDDLQKWPYSAFGINI